MLLAKIFFCCCGWGFFFYRYRGSQDLPLNELKPKSLESIIEAWTSTEKPEKKHHEHGGLLCFIAVNSACVMTKELSSFWIKGSRFVLEPQTISWLLGPYALYCSLSQVLLCSVITTHLSVFNSKEGKKKECATVLCLDAWKRDIFFSVKVSYFLVRNMYVFLFCSVFLRGRRQLYKWDILLWLGIFLSLSTDLYQSCHSISYILITGSLGAGAINYIT